MVIIYNNLENSLDKICNTCLHILLDIFIRQCTSISVRNFSYTISTSSRGRVGR